MKYEFFWEFSKFLTYFFINMDFFLLKLIIMDFLMQKNLMNINFLRFMFYQYNFSFLLAKKLFLIKTY